MILRPYQTAALRQLAPVLFQKPLLVAPTGSGKTVMGAKLVKTFNAPTLWVAHRRELINQAADKLAALGLHTGVILSGEAENLFAKVQVASIQTLKNRDLPKVGLIVVDEAHHATAAGYARLFGAGVPVVGLTATPFRLDGRPLGDMFGAMVVAAHVDELVTAGTLHAPRVYCAAPPNLDGVETARGDFKLKSLSDLLNKPTLVGDIVAEWLKHAAGAQPRTVCFAIDVSTAGRLRRLPRRGSDRRAYRRHHPRRRTRRHPGTPGGNETTVVSNCMVLTEGWDLPALECAILARPTDSLNLHLQMIGRVMRAAEGKGGAVVLDHAGNHHRHGPVTRRLEYSLNGEVRSSAAGDALGLKRCDVCGLMLPLDAAACTDCGTAFVAKVKGDRKQVDGSLVAFDDTSFHLPRRDVGAVLRPGDGVGAEPAVGRGAVQRPLWILAGGGGGGVGRTRRGDERAEAGGV
jgi:DNA repair protein RadD